MRNTIAISSSLSSSSAALAATTTFIFHLIQRQGRAAFKNAPFLPEDYQRVSGTEIKFARSLNL